MQLFIIVVVLIMALPILLLIPLAREGAVMRPTLVLLCAVVIVAALALPTLLYILDLARLFLGW